MRAPLWKFNLKIWNVWFYIGTQLPSPQRGPLFFKGINHYLFDEISHLIWFFKSKDKRPTTKEEKKEQKRKLKNPDPEECSVGVFDPRSCKKAAHAKLNIFLETSGNSKQTTINGEVSFVDLFLWLPLLIRCNFLIWHNHTTGSVQRKSFLQLAIWASWS